MDLPTPRYDPLELDDVELVPLQGRESLVDRQCFAEPIEPPAGFQEFLSSLPRFLAVERLLKLRDAVVAAHRSSRPVVLAFGAHVVKVGLSPLLIDLMERGIVTALATNGAGAIHDLEIALAGQTSEDVARTIGAGTFGMVRETSQVFAAACRRGRESGRGLGWALGEQILGGDGSHRDLSVFAAATRLGVPLTTHVAIGTDIVHQVPGVDGADIGAASYLDFRIMASVVADLEDGVWINMGSAVVLPEVFLKCISVARNLGNSLERVTTANLDMIQHYRPRANVLTRPVREPGISITGHHELLLPLLRLAILSKIAELDVTDDAAPASGHGEGGSVS